mmetsp:Transcript_72010/g.126890  ORF Transcript_72010/g.126890 Transcript_72010/m.126890 type:complete len:103 (-) Transcript_72010:221-529(-)
MCASLTLLAGGCNALGQVQLQLRGSYCICTTGQEVLLGNGYRWCQPGDAALEDFGLVRSIGEQAVQEAPKQIACSTWQHSVKNAGLDRQEAQVWMKGSIAMQ